MVLDKELLVEKFKKGLKFLPVIKIALGPRLKILPDPPLALLCRTLQPSLNLT
jgi:hypothetical protein